MILDSGLLFLDHPVYFNAEFFDRWIRTGWRRRDSVVVVDQEFQEFEVWFIAIAVDVYCTKLATGLHWAGDTRIVTPRPPKITGHPPRTKIAWPTHAHCGRYSSHAHMAGEAFLGIQTIWRPRLSPELNSVYHSILKNRTPRWWIINITRIRNVWYWQPRS